MDRDTKDGIPPGIVLRVDTKDHLFEGASGYSYVKNRTPMQPDDAFRIGSITKLFTAVVILQLLEEGRLTLDDPLSLWLPEIAQNLSFGEKITLRHLLSHTSGVHNYTNSLQFFADLVQAATIEQEKQTVIGNCSQWTRPFILETYVYEASPSFEPNVEADNWSYSNTGFLLLGLVIEVVTEKPLATVYRERILDPLDMYHTYLGCAETLGIELAHGYSRRSGSNPGYDKEGRFRPFDVTMAGIPAWADGGLISTAPDLSRFIRALFMGKLFQKDETLKVMLEQPTSIPYGLGIQVLDGQTYGHTGGIDGYLTSLSYDRKNDIVTVLLYNADYSDPSYLVSRVPTIIAPVVGGKAD